MTKFDYSNPHKRPGSGGARAYPPSGGEDWYPLTNVTWIPETREVDIEVCETMYERVPARNLRERLKQIVGLSPKVVETIVCHVEKQQEIVGYSKRYDR